MKFEKIALWLLIIGGIFWGLFAIMGEIIGTYINPILATVIYALVGVSALVVGYGEVR